MDVLKVGDPAPDFDLPVSGPQRVVLVYAPQRAVSK